MDTAFFERLWEQIKYNPLEPLLFNSGFFLFFFLACIAFYHIFINNRRAQVLFLTAASLFFYYKSSGFYFLLLIFSCVIDFYAGKWIYDSKSKAQRNILLTVSMVMNLGILGYFKYTNFFFDTVTGLGGPQFEFIDIFLPVGVSFFTFQSMSYTIDLYKGHMEPEKKFIDFLFFVSFFPQLVAGPIVRASDFLPQIHQSIKINKADMGKAIFLISAGLLKKAVIADYISINFVDRVMEWPTRFTGVENLLAMYGYSLQLYCDFSGYSDMAIGIALLFGFRLMTNFNAPYKAYCMTDIWHRWHISLSTWLRDYLYFSLGGNRKGEVRTYINLLLTMVIGGLWHGAAWRFVIWGSIHGVALALEKLFNIPKIFAKKWYLKLLGVIITFHIWTFSLLFFRPSSLDISKDILNQIFNYFKPEVFTQFIGGFTLVFTLMILGYLSHYIPDRWVARMEQWIGDTPVYGQAVLLTLVIWIAYQFKSAGIQPFIYFQF
ncbi:MAG: MBOAT family O-acyltransferase [Ignavibacteriaceae bacterium]|jgi:D-alanyl-lipoteichoic acid acyltransferase DltB (MBOAT superfamily)|nr:MBOAT family O-acyltransferase [Ignavibacteriaceae bacterium]